MTWFMYTDWEITAHTLGQDLSHELGVPCTADIEVLLQKVTLVDNCGTFDFDSQAAMPQGAFATFIVLLFPNNTVCFLSYE